LAVEAAQLALAKAKDAGDSAAIGAAGKLSMLPSRKQPATL
jgi:hypothetical protein